jgi:hypothetical protein
VSCIACHLLRWQPSQWQSLPTGRAPMSRPSGSSECGLVRELRFGHHGGRSWATIGSFLRSSIVKAFGSRSIIASRGLDHQHRGSRVRASGLAIVRGPDGEPPVLYSAGIRGTGIGFWKSTDRGVRRKLSCGASQDYQGLYPPVVNPYDLNHCS